MSDQPGAQQPWSPPQAQQGAQQGPYPGQPSQGPYGGQPPQGPYGGQPPQGPYGGQPPVGNGGSGGGKGPIRALLAVVALLLLIVVAGGAYLLGTRAGDDPAIATKDAAPAATSALAAPSEPAAPIAAPTEAQPATPEQPAVPAGGVHRALSDPCAPLVAAATALGGTVSETRPDSSSQGGDVAKRCRYTFTAKDGATLSGSVTGTTYAPASGADEGYAFIKRSDLNTEGIVVEAATGLAQPAYLSRDSKPNGGGGYNVAVGAKDGNLVVTSKGSFGGGLPLATGKQIVLAMAKAYAAAG
jgi:hypothetical protein